MACSFVKQVFARSSAVVPFCPAYVATNRRGFTVKAFFSDLFGRISPERLQNELNKIPHLLCMAVSLEEGNKGIKLSLNIPGNEKTTEDTDQRLCIFLDMGVVNWEDYRLRRLETKWSETGNAMLIKARMQNKVISEDCTRLPEGFAAKKYTAVINIPRDNIFKNYETEKKYEGLMITIHKNTDASVVPFYPHSVATNRHGVTDKPFFDDLFDRFLPNRISKWLLNIVPHTLYMKVTGEREGRKVYLGEGKDVSLNIPGNQKMKETAESVFVFLDMGLKNEEEFDYQSLEANLKKKHKVLFIKGFMRKHEICRNYSARVHLPPENIYQPHGEPVKTEIKDGGLMVTIPKLKED